MNILWLKTELLHPIDKGGKIRTYGMLKALKRDHRVTYLTLDTGSPQESADKALEYCDELVRIPHSICQKFSASFYAKLLANLATKLPYALRAYRSDGMRQAITELVSAGEVDLIVCDFLSPSVNVPEGLNVPTVLFQHNVEALIWRRHYEVHCNPLKKAYLWLEWHKMRAAEARECGRYDKVVAVSEHDAEELKDSYGLTDVADVPTGVDVDYFSPSAGAVTNPFEIVFVGSMDWLPNQDAIGFFVDDVLPPLTRSIPEVRFTVVGRSPPEALVERAKTDPCLTVTGLVDDVRPFMERASVFVVPVRIGSGTRLKIFEAMAMGKPVVSTTVGAEGLPLKPGEDILIADDPAEFVAAVKMLLEKQNFAHEFGRRSADLVRSRFGWHGVTQQFSEVCKEAVRGGAQTRCF